MRTKAQPGLPKLNKRVLGPIYDHVFSSLDNEVGGVLVGHYLEPGSAPTITGSIAALAADGARASVTFTHEAWSDIHDALDRRKDKAQIVGWYHSHPGFGIFLSEHDLFIHRNFFSDPAQVAFVVDPHAAREGTFGWVDGDIVKLDERDTGRPARRPPPAGGAPSREAPAPGIRGQAGSRANLIALGIGAVILGASAGLILDQPSDGIPKQRHKTTSTAKSKAASDRSKHRRQQRTTSAHAPATTPAPQSRPSQSTPTPPPAPRSGGTHAQPQTGGDTGGTAGPPANAVPPPSGR
jgi:proteasome lid subunit RPN8/RPN11